MRAVIQRVHSARVETDGHTAGSIGPGLLILLGIRNGDTSAGAEWLARKTAALRIFPDEQGAMNRSVVDAGLETLVVSQFTLLARTSKGTRPSFNDAARPEVAIPLYEEFNRLLAAATGRPVATGIFGARMDVHLVNDGPVTLVIDSLLRE